MKVAFPTNRGEKIAKHSSFCASFLIIDTQTGERVTVANPMKEAAKAAEVQADGLRHLGKGRMVAALLADAGVDACICVDAKTRFLQRLAQQGIAVYTAEERQIDSALEAFMTQETVKQMPREGTGNGRQNGFGRGAGRGGKGNRRGSFGERRGDGCNPGRPNRGGRRMQGHSRRGQNGSRGIGFAVL
jgi:predicted Fe-Mo cluster-binding NifX family protein